MAFLQITPIQSSLNLFKSDYPSGVTAAQVRAALIDNTNISKSSDITEVSLSTSPNIGFAQNGFTSQQYTVFVNGYLQNDEVIVPSTNEFAYSITVFYINDDSAALDSTPPVITPKGSTDIIIETGDFSTALTFIDTYFTVTDPESGVDSLLLNPSIDFQSTKSRGSVKVVATNGDGFTAEYTFFLTIKLPISQTPPTITGPSFLTIYTDENMTNTKLIETKGYTISSVTGVSSISYSPAINYQALGTTILTITVFAGNNTNASFQTSITVENRPAPDFDAPQVTQNNSEIIYLKSVYPSFVPANVITTDIRNSFFVEDANDFEMVVGPTVVNFTEVGSKTYLVTFVDEFGNISLSNNIIVKYLFDGDLTPPNITGPASITFTAGQNKTQIDVIANYTLSDNLDPEPQWFNLTPTTFNTVGVFNYLLRAIDASGNVNSRTITVNVVAPTSAEDTTPPTVNGPTSKTFFVDEEAVLADLLNLFTVTDNVSPPNEITNIATINGSTIETNFEFPLGITTVVLVWADEAENFTLPRSVVVSVVERPDDDDPIFDEPSIGDGGSVIAELRANQEYSGPVVSTIINNTWTPISWVVDPVLTNYTIDGLSDEININFISRIKTTRLERGELVRVVYDSQSTRDTWGIPTFDNRQRPTNHDVMLLDSGTMTKIGNQNIYRHSYKLVELIEVLKDYRLPTLTFTSFAVSKVTDAGTGVLSTYYANPYNAFTILQRAIKQSNPNTILEINPVPNLIKIMDGSFLQSQMVGVDHQFEEATLYDVVTEIGRIVGRTPVLYLNPNFGLTDSSQYMLFFEKDNEHTVGVVNKVDLLANSSEYVEATLQNKGATQIVVDGHNIIGSKVSIWPSDDMYGFAQSVEEQALSAKDKPLKIILPYKISSAEVVRFKKYLITVFDNDDPSEGSSIDGEMPIYKYNDWLVLDSDQRENSAYYKEGENEVFFGSGVDDGTNDWENYFTSASYRKRIVGGDSTVYDYILFQVDYFPLIDLQARIGDGKQTTFNQVNAMVDSETLGLQVENYLKGNESNDITVSKIVYSYNDILKPTQLVNWDNEIYTVVSTSFNSGRVKNGVPQVMYKVAYQLNKEVRRNFTLNAPTNQREYQIVYDNVFDRFNVIKDKVKVWLTTDVRDDEAPILSNFKYLRSLPSGVNYRYVLGALESSNLYPTVESVAFQASSTIFTNVGQTTFEGQTKYIMAHPVKTVFGKSLLINFKMHNNTFAGTRLFIQDGVNDDADFLQRQVSYTDPFGKIQRSEINLISQDFDNLDDIFIQTEQYPQIIGNPTASPVVTPAQAYATITSNAKTLVRITGYEVDKDTRENFNVTYQLDFEGLNGTRVGSGLVQYCGLYQTRPYTSIPFRVVKLRNAFYNPDDRIDNSDIVGTVAVVDSITPYYSNGLQIIFTDDYTFDTTSTYALVEITGTEGIFFTYKILATMGDRSSLVETDTIFMYY